tara:strand:- start:1947 stop:2423 length:477 start_codon:yes stop_codon:yes gene_type:complete
MHPKIAIHTQDGVIVRTDMDSGMYPDDGEWIEGSRIVHRIWDFEGLSEMDFISQRVWEDSEEKFIEVPRKPNVYATWNRSEVPAAWTWDPEDVLVEIRHVRNKKISETDWMFVEDSPLTEEEKQVVLEYRQLLRDLPSTLDFSKVGSVDDVVWPVLGE